MAVHHVMCGVWFRRGFMPSERVTEGGLCSQTHTVPTSNLKLYPIARFIMFGPEIRKSAIRHGTWVMGDVIHRLKYLRNLLRLSPGHPPNPPYLTVDSGAIANAPSRRLRHKQRNNRLNNPCLVYGAGLALEVCNRRNLTTRQLMRMLDAQSIQYHITPRTSEGKRSPRTEWEGGGGRLTPRHIMDSRAAGVLRHAAQLPVARSILGAGAPHAQLKHPQRRTGRMA